MNYNQFCPIAKSAEILGERWNILILREVLMGGRRFNTLQRGLGDISPVWWQLGNSPVDAQFDIAQKFV